MTQQEPSIVRFGDFELDEARRLLRTAADGKLVAVTPRAFDTLAYLIAHAGELVTKQELLDSVWPNVVVEENNLTQAISVLRRTLGERPRQHRYIATVPGRGYRFVCRLERPPQSSNETSSVSVSADAQAPPIAEAMRKPHVRSALFGTVSIIVLIAAMFVQQAMISPGESVASLRLTDLRLLSQTTTNHSQPTLSPDGTFVAFVSDTTGTRQIHVQNLASGEVVRVRVLGAGASHPSWSPDNDSIVFSSAGRIFRVGALGVQVPHPIINEGKNPRFSADGQWIVYEHEQDIRMADAGSLSTRTVPGVPITEWTFFDKYPSLSPDNSEIVYFRQQFGPIGDYWIVSVDGSALRQLTFDPAEGGRAEWAADGYIYFPSEREGTRTLWRISPAGGAPEAVTSSVGQDGDPTLSRDARRIVYTNTRVETRFIVFDPTTDRREEIYRSRAKSSFPMISHDGSRVAFFQKADPEEQIFLLSSEGGQARQLTRATQGQRRLFPRWSPDDEAIYYYETLPNGTWSLRMQPLAGGPSEPIRAEFPWPSNKDIDLNPDGETVVYVEADPLDPSNLDRRRVVVDSLASGQRIELDPRMKFAPSWSPDGRSVLATAVNQVMVCGPDGPGCDEIYKAAPETPTAPDLELGQYSRWSADGSRIFFNQPTNNPSMLELWVVNRDGTDPRMLTVYGPVDPLDGRFQVLNDDRVLWNEDVRSNSDLWIGTLN